jgi:hypothetical protein
MLKCKQYELNKLRKEWLERLHILRVVIRVKQSARLLDPEEGDIMLLLPDGNYLPVNTV